MSNSGSGSPGTPRDVIFGFVGIAVGLAILELVALVVTQPEFGMHSLAVFVPLVIVGAGLAGGLGQRAAVSVQKAETDETALDSTSVSFAEPSGAEDSTRSDPYDDVDYLAALRHEFRTPLNAVLGFADVLLGGIDGPVNESQREDLEIIRASGMKLQILLDSALDLSQLASGTLRPDLDTVDAAEVVARAVREAKQLWGGKRRSSLVGAVGTIPVSVDATRLRRSILVLADLLAAEYRDAAIDVEVGRVDEHLVVSVCANPSGPLALDALPTPAEVIRAEDPMKIRRWPVAVTSELVTTLGGSLYHGDSPARFVIRLPAGGAA
ncbi:MAG: HAMP domain-containing sensor histidine kinase [Polyangiales bacterium]